MTMPTAAKMKEKTYCCKECRTPMVKRGAGLGKWHCPKGHNYRVATIEVQIGRSSITRTKPRHYGRAVVISK